MGFFGFSCASLVGVEVPLVGAPFVVGFVEGGTVRLVSGCECNDEAVEAVAEGTGEAAGFAVAIWGLPIAGAAMVEERYGMCATKGVV